MWREPFETPVFNDWRWFQSRKARQDLQMVQLADFDADPSKYALGALCQVKRSRTQDRCQEELLKKGEDNDTELNGCSYWCAIAGLLSGGRLEGGDCLERGKGRASKVTEKLLMEWRKGIKGIRKKRQTRWRE